VTATFFVLGSIAERHPDLVARIVSAGHEVASHGFSHRRVFELDESSFAEELDRANTAIEKAGAPRPIGFRAPEWSINDRAPWGLGVLARAGFRYDSSMSPLRLVGNPDYPQVPHRRATPHGTVVEIPPLVGRRFGQQYPLGGGWGLRMSRPSTVVREIEARVEAAEIGRRRRPGGKEVGPAHQQANEDWRPRCGESGSVEGCREHGVSVQRLVDADALDCRRRARRLGNRGQPHRRCERQAPRHAAPPFRTHSPIGPNSAPARISSSRLANPESLK
jgi:hypothetical protein